MMNAVVKSDIVSACKILIVDDSIFTRQMLREFCVSVGCVQILEATNGKEGLEKIISEKPDMVFLDMYMPLMDGLEVCQELRRVGVLDDVVIIMQSMSEDPEFRARAFNAGVTDFISKPLHQRELAIRAIGHLERQVYRKKITTDYTRIRAELDEATILQKILLPQPDVLENIQHDMAVDIACSYNPASELAGDYISVRKLSRNRVALISADVSGHGISAALFAFSIHTLLDTTVVDELMPGKALEVLNNQLFGIVPRGRFATIFLGVLDTDSNTLHYAAAASPAPILLAGGATTLLNTVGHLLGAVQNSSYKTISVPFHSGDALVLYSDALLETVDADGAVLEDGKLINIVLSHKNGSADAMMRPILSDFSENYAAQQCDDLSLLICKRN